MCFVGNAPEPEPEPELAQVGARHEVRLLPKPNAWTELTVLGVALGRLNLMSNINVPCQMILLQLAPLALHFTVSAIVIKEQKLPFRGKKEQELQSQILHQE